jgi:hypothetical protein
MNMHLRHLPRFILHAPRQHERGRQLKWYTTVFHQATTDTLDAVCCHMTISHTSLHFTSLHFASLHFISLHADCSLSPTSLPPSEVLLKPARICKSYAQYRRERFSTRDRAWKPRRSPVKTVVTCCAAAEGKW